MKLFGKKVFILMSGALLIMSAGCDNKEKVVSELAANEQKSEEKTVQSDNMEVFPVVQPAADSYFKKPAQSITAADVFEKLILNFDPSYLIVDVRETAAFAAGHIQGSVNIPYKMTADPNQIANLPKDKKIVVVCYSGHTASQTAALWNLLGYDAIPMVNGMGGWTSDATLGTPLPKKPFEFTVETLETKTGSFDLPAPQSKQYASETAVILGAADDYLKTGLPPIIKPADIDAKADDFLLVDLRAASEYKNGHIPGAINIAFETLGEVEQLKKLSPDKKIVLIDHDGTMSSKAARILNLMGYKAFAMKDGMRVWTSDPAINGIAPISSEKAMEFPVKILNTKLDTEAGAASCG